MELVRGSMRSHRRHNTEQVEERTWSIKELGNERNTESKADGKIIRYSITFC